MACDISKGRLEPCKDVVGGVKNLYFANYEIYTTLVDDVITDISSVNGTPTSAVLYTWEVKGATHL